MVVGQIGLLGQYGTIGLVHGFFTQESIRLALGIATVQNLHLQTEDKNVMEIITSSNLQLVIGIVITLRLK